MQIHIDKVDLEFFNKLILKGVIIYDLEKDTLISINKLHAGILFFKPKKQKIYLNKIILEETEFNVKKTGEETFNYQFLFEAMECQRFHFAFDASQS